METYLHVTSTCNFCFRSERRTGSLFLLCISISPIPLWASANSQRVETSCDLPAMLPEGNSWSRQAGLHLPTPVSMVQANHPYDHTHLQDNCLRSGDFTMWALTIPGILLSCWWCHFPMTVFVHCHLFDQTISSFVVQIFFESATVVSQQNVIAVWKKHLMILIDWARTANGNLQNIAMDGYIRCQI